jgi:hypothetical protein
MWTPWRQANKLVVPASGTASFVLAASRPIALDKLTIWASTGARVLSANLSFDVRLNTKSIASTVTVAAPQTVNTIIYATAATSMLLIPTDTRDIDPLVFDVLVTNAGLTDVEVSMIAVGIGL